ncbi:MAG: hypothetical protein IJT04_03800, partial [Bacteroidales bacterium]|nr:hypothetical protein [Bacteroidales bacterium]
RLRCIGLNLAVGVLNHVEAVNAADAPHINQRVALRATAEDGQMTPCAIMLELVIRQSSLAPVVHTHYQCTVYYIIHDTIRLRFHHTP